MAEQAKKRRVTRACDFCRLKRAKCDGLSPTCSFCALNNANCTYTRATKKRGLPTGYIHDLERKVATLQIVLLNLASLETSEGKTVEQKIVELLETGDSGDFLSQITQHQQQWEQLVISHAVSQFILQNNMGPARRKSFSSLSGPEMAQSVLMSTTGTNMSQSANPPTVSNIILPPNTSPSVFLTNIKSELPDLASYGSENVPLAELYIPSPLADFALVNVTDQPFFFKDDIFQFIADELDPGEARDKPVVLHYYGLPQQISGFSGSTIAKYTKYHNGRRNPFRVGLVFNISSSVMAANAREQRKLPLDIFRFPQNLRKLVDNYFQIYHLWLPMLDRILVIRQVFRLQQHPEVTPDILDCNVLALLWAILALESENHDDCTKYVRNSVLALESSTASTIETIQLMILLGLHFYKTGDWDNSWVLVLSATRMAMDVKLMRPAVLDEELKKDDEKKHPAWASLDKINRERTWALCYVVNTLLGARMGRSPLVRESDWEIPTISEDGWEEWESWKSFHTPDIYSLDLGRCLLVFNRVLQVIAILNCALSCLIQESSNGQEEARHMRLIFEFQLRLDEWVEALPAHCQLQPDLSPMVMFMHCCHSLAWFVVCVKLSGLKPNLQPERDKEIRLRNQFYTSACVKVSSILGSQGLTVLLNYPFVDHVILMALNFPLMNELDPQAAAQHSSRLIEVLEIGSRNFMPCQITWDLYQLQNGVDIDVENKHTEKLLAKALIKESPNPPVQHKPLLLFFGENQKFPALPSFDYGRPRFASYHSAPKEELDLFMLDTDFAKNDLRLDKFMRNLGYIGLKSNLLGNLGSNSQSEQNTSRYSGDIGNRR